MLSSANGALLDSLTFMIVSDMAHQCTTLKKTCGKYSIQISPFFQDWLSSKSPVFKQTTCGILGCAKKSVKRVSFKLSGRIYEKVLQHLSVGAGQLSINSKKKMKNKLLLPHRPLFRTQVPVPSLRF